MRVRKTCTSGHDLTIPGADVITNKGQHQCRECRKLREKKRRDALREFRAECVKRYG